VLLLTETFESRTNLSQNDISILDKRKIFLCTELNNYLPDVNRSVIFLDTLQKKNKKKQRKMNKEGLALAS
jgi:hypothetical protein